MKEAKIFDLKLKNYREQLEEYHPSIDASAKRTRVVNGVEIVGQELKQLEEEYNAILNKILALLNQLQDDNSKLKEFVSTIIGLWFIKVTFRKSQPSNFPNPELKMILRNQSYIYLTTFLSFSLHSLTHTHLFILNTLLPLS